MSRSMRDQLCPSIVVALARWQPAPLPSQPCACSLLVAFTATLGQPHHHIGPLPLTAQALISGCTAFFRPASLSWMTTQQFEWGVGLLMLAMGLSMTKEDFKKVGACAMLLWGRWLRKQS